MTSKELYKIYRQASSLRDALEVGNESAPLDDAVKIADTLNDEIFKCVGKLAAYEIDNDYWENKNKSENE